MKQLIEWLNSLPKADRKREAAIAKRNMARIEAFTGKGFSFEVWDELTDILG